MTLDEFKLEMRLCRGKLKDMDKDLSLIYNLGIKELRDFALTKKLMGVSNIAELSLLDQNQQRLFCSWIASKHWKAEKNEIELKFLELKGK